LNQTLSNNDYEIIVVDDASTDHTSQVIQSYSGFVRPIILKENVGLAEARNKGIEVALGRYIVNLDADDYMDRDLLYVESLFLNRNPHWDAVSCDYFIIGEHEEHIKRINGMEHPIACGLMFRTDQLQDIGLYDKSFRACEDEDLRIRFEKKYKIYHIDLPLYRYRKHKDNMTKDKALIENYKNSINRKYNNDD